MIKLLFLLTGIVLLIVAIFIGVLNEAGPFTATVITIITTALTLQTFGIIYLINEVLTPSAQVLSEAADILRKQHPMATSNEVDTNDETKH